MDEWISDEMTFLLGEQKASRETRSCWPFFKDSYNVFSYTHTQHTPLALPPPPPAARCVFLFCSVSSCTMADGCLLSPTSLLLLLFFFGSGYTEVPYNLCNVYVYVYVYIVYSRS